MIMIYVGIMIIDIVVKSLFHITVICHDAWTGFGYTFCLARVDFNTPVYIYSLATYVLGL